MKSKSIQYIDLQNKITKRGCVCGIDPSAAEHAISLVNIEPGNIELVSGSVKINKEVHTAKDRRLYRSVRRNIDHRNARLNTFADIAKCVTGLTYQESKKQLRSFQVPAKYPTVYHMMQDMLHSDRKFTVEEYLSALYFLNHHRGYMYGLQSEAKDCSLRECVHQLNQCYECSDKDIHIDEAVADEISKIGFYKSGKRCVAEKKAQREMVKNLTDDVSADFYDSLLSGTFGKKTAFFFEPLEGSICLSTLQEDDIEDFKNKYSSENTQVLSCILDIYNALSSTIALGENGYVCDYKVRKYDLFGQRTKEIKALYKKFATQKAYNNMFRSKSLDSNFNALISRSSASSAFKYSKFTGMIKEDLKALKAFDEDLYDTVTDECHFVKPSAADVDVKFSHAVKKREFMAIVEKMCLYYPELRTVRYDKYPEYSVIDAFVKNFDFQVDYFVGPLNQNNSNAWIEFKHNPCKIDPFNYEKEIDFSKTINNWMKRLIGHCFILPDEFVMPKYSMTYAKFVVLNQINCLRIDGECAPVEIKQAVFNDLFFNSDKNVTIKTVAKYLKNTFGFSKDIVVTGITSTIQNPFISVKKIVRSINSVKCTDNLVDDIAYVLTAMQDVKSKAEKLAELNQLSEEEIKSLSFLSFDGWGELSKEFLLMTCDADTGMNVLDSMFYTGLNLEAIKAQKGFREAIQSKMRASQHPDKMDIVKAVTEYCQEKKYSPAVTSGVIYIFKNLAQMIKQQGFFPEYICVESTRTGGDKGEDSVARKNKLLKVYKEGKLDKSEPVLYRELTEVDNSALRITKNYLFFLQAGYDAYTGEKIAASFRDFLALDPHSYDRDHIVPQWLKVDNSIENNLVLTNAHTNQTIKRDFYPLPDKIRAPKVIETWKYLLKAGLFTQEKFSRLARSTELSDAELHTFLDSELAITSQVAMALKDLIVEYDLAKVIFVSPVYSAKFRSDYHFPKCREINHLHHFEDATLTAVLGYCYEMNNLQFKNCRSNWQDVKNKKWNASKVFERKIFDTHGQVIFDPQVTPGQIIEAASKPIPVFHKPSVKSDLFPATIYKKTAIKPTDNLHTVCPAAHKGTIGASGVYKRLNTAGILEVETMQRGEKHRKCIMVKTVHYEKFLADRHWFDAKLDQMFPNGYSITKFYPPNSVVFLDNERRFPVLYTGSTGNKITYASVYEPMRGRDFSEESFRVINALTKIRNNFPYEGGYNLNKIPAALNNQTITYNDLIITEASLMRLYDEFVAMFHNEYYKRINPSITYHSFSKEGKINKRCIRISNIFTSEERRNFVKLSINNKIFYVISNLIKALKSAYGRCVLDVVVS